MEMITLSSQPLDYWLSKVAFVNDHPGITEPNVPPIVFTVGLTGSMSASGSATLFVTPEKLHLVRNGLSKKITNALFTREQIYDVEQTSRNVTVYWARLGLPTMNVGMPMTGKNGRLVLTFDLNSRARLVRALNQCGYAVSVKRTWVGLGLTVRER